MSKYYKVKTTYLKTDESENGASVVSEVRLFAAVDYTDAQARALEIIEHEGLCGECEFDIQKSSYDSCLYRSTIKVSQLKDVKESDQELNNVKDFQEIDEETYWYEIRITKFITNDKGEEKYITQKYLVEGLDLEDSIDVFRAFFKDEDEDYWWFSSIQETPIQEVILSEVTIN